MKICYNILKNIPKNASLVCVITQLINTNNINFSNTRFNAPKAVNTSIKQTLVAHFAGFHLSPKPHFHNPISVQTSAQHTTFKHHTALTITLSMLPDYNLPKTQLSAGDSRIYRGAFDHRPSYRPLASLGPIC